MENLFFYVNYSAFGDIPIAHAGATESFENQTCQGGIAFALFHPDHAMFINENHFKIYENSKFLMIFRKNINLNIDMKNSRIKE